MKEFLFHVDTALITPRTVTRRFREQDGQAFYELFQNNYHRLEELNSELPQTLGGPEMAEFWIRSQLADWLLQKAFSFAIWGKDSAQMIGWVALQEYREHLSDSKITGFIDQEYAEKGFMTEVVLALLDYAFDDLQLEKIRLLLAADNYAAQRLARKCYFTREGDLRLEGWKPTGERFDLVAFGLTRVDYETL